MRLRTTLSLSAVVLLGVAALGTAATATAAPAPRDQAVATMIYTMDEPPGSTVMHDSGGLGLDGAIGNEVHTGVVVAGATGYGFDYLPNYTPPTHPQHIIRIPDNAALDPDTNPYSIEMRFQTTTSVGHLMQKGQSTTTGGQIKLTVSGGHLTCYFNGSNGRVGAGWKTPINDGEWHTVLCQLDGTGVTLYVDGVRRGHKNGSPGTLNNAFDVTIGGKPKCNQTSVGCDYFGGTIDYLKITKG